MKLINNELLYHQFLSDNWIRLIEKNSESLLRIKIYFHMIHAIKDCITNYCYNYNSTTSEHRHIRWRRIHTTQRSCWIL